MIVKNGGIFFCKTLVSDESIPANTLKNINGTMYASSISKGDLFLNEARQNDNQRGIKMRFGVGTTAPTAEDYCLAKRTVSGTDINTLLMCTNASVGYSTHGSVIYTFSFQNSSTAPITVKELCLECSVSEQRALYAGLLAEELVEHIRRYNTEKATQIDLLCKAFGDRIILSVRDNGVIFDPAKVKDDSEDFSNLKIINSVADKVEYTRAIGLNNMLVELGR
jgi:anti-sigma regulatory factor (Ser/Thr protein kinase)